MNFNGYSYPADMRCKGKIMKNWCWCAPEMPDTVCFSKEADYEYEKERFLFEGAPHGGG